MNIDEMIDQILAALDRIESIEDRDQWSNKKWTGKIKTALCTVGQGIGHYICASGVDLKTGCGEWLYDVCWLDYVDVGDGEKRLRSMPMAAECEWGQSIGAIEDDFSKLLVARASLRVMVCDSGWSAGNAAGRATAERLQQWVGAYNGNQVGDVYLLIVYTQLDSRRYRLNVTDEGAQLPGLVPLEALHERAGRVNRGLQG